ncbi:uncharacterized protein LOC123864548 [Maniola jurtina]|uniref:uncharacterized protein LOC123864548 n=1 Tax=Maniola jurtina TaxID=191418 RepID=UPI001E68744B|nr:uncharacterized protein LOC123864548 [Maniola jurtina]
MFCIIFTLLFVSCCSVEVNNPVAKVNKTENILCRECGSQILTSDTIISKSSAASQYSFSDTIFNRKDVLVQILVQDIFWRYPVITSSKSSCLGKGDWEDDELWFPDYVMKPCFCPECGAFLGWMFQIDSLTTIYSTDQFFGLILTNIISENFTNSLLTYPYIV